MIRYKNYELVEIPGREYYIGDISKKVKVYTKGFYVTRYLITNQSYLEFLLDSAISNEEDGTFRWINTRHINSKIVPTSEVFYQEKGGEHYRYDPIISKDKYVIVEGYENHPVVCVNWLGADAFAKYIGGRLPSEAEWEIAAKGGNDDNMYPWGNDPPKKELANYGEYYSGTTLVGVFPPNAFGLYDMAGNLREWCQDWFYGEPASINISDLGLTYDKVMKGGGWNKPAFHLKCAFRNGKWFRLGGASIGFRVVFDRKFI